MCSVAHEDTYSQGILHRDISPNNILISEDRRFDSGMLINWDLCKARIGAEEEGIDRRQSRTVRSVLQKYALN